MHRDQQLESSLKPSRYPARKEWEPGREQSHQLEAREHARQGGKTRRTQDLRAAEAAHQIRELVER